MAREKIQLLTKVYASEVPPCSAFYLSAPVRRLCRSTGCSDLDMRGSLLRVGRYQRDSDASFAYGFMIIYPSLCLYITLLNKA